ncbi:MAG: DNA-binding protein WhiA [Ruminococcaceae bacterium]|nr:DNA-binding protein WhiA [Oscillospiraceae bacterium]
MSFAEALREELASLPIKKNCCRRALCAGFLLAAERKSAHTLTLRCRFEVAVPLITEALEKVFVKAPLVHETASHGHRYTDLTVESPACARLVGQLQGDAADTEELLKLSRCESCRSAFLRGAFLCMGSVTDPQKSSHLEFLLPNGRGEVALTSFLTDAGYPPRRIARASGCGLYYKDSTSVGDLFTLMGSVHMIFDYYNTRIERDIRNNENRATNCVARNIEKSISAAARQMEAIGILMDCGRLDGLEESLRTTALLRYRNPDATLDELKELHVPPISKSGLNHRLQRLLDVAREYEEKHSEK